MTLVRLLSTINSYALWLYGAGLVALLLTFYELREARKSRKATIFSLEKELASTREKRARTAFLAVAGLLALLTLLRYQIVPSHPSLETPEPTPTRLIIEAPTMVPVTPTPTVTRVPTRPRPTAAPPTPTPMPTAIPAPACPDVGICISAPATGSTVTGQVAIRGTANIEGFQFYKVEYGIGESPGEWHSIGDIRRTAVANGTLAEWNTSGFPSGPVKLRLTVVDATGNFPPPYEVRVTVRSGV